MLAPCSMTTPAGFTSARRPTAGTPANRWRWGWERVRRRARARSRGLRGTAGRMLGKDFGADPELRSGFHGPCLRWTWRYCTRPRACALSACDGWMPGMCGGGRASCWNVPARSTAPLPWTSGTNGRKRTSRRRVSTAGHGPKRRRTRVNRAQLSGMAAPMIAVCVRLMPSIPARAWWK